MLGCRATTLKLTTTECDNDVGLNCIAVVVVVVGATSARTTSRLTQLGTARVVLTR